MAIDVSQNEEISGGVEDGGRKGIVSAIRRRRANSQFKFNDARKNPAIFGNYFSVG